MTAQLPFLNLSDSEFNSYLNEQSFPALSFYSNLVFQPYVVSDSHDNLYNPDSHISSYSDNFSCKFFNLDDPDLEYIKNRQFSLSMCSLNIRSIPKNLNNYLNDFSHINFDVMGFSETRLCSDLETLHQVPGFDFVSSNRNTLGGGVALYIKDSLNAILVRDMSLANEFL